MIPSFPLFSLSFHLSLTISIPSFSYLFLSLSDDSKPANWTPNDKPNGPKRKASEALETSEKKVKPTPECNPSVNEGCFISLDVFNGKQYVNSTDFEMQFRPNFFGDPRINRVHTYPKNEADHKWMSPQSAATASSHGGRCQSCLPGENKVGSHSVNDKPRLF